MTERMHRVKSLGNEDGMTTTGMAIALLLTISLVLSSAQIYRIGSASAEIQEVADACALAAQNEVAEYLVAVRVCDALVLSMNLLGTTLHGVGAAAACVPATQALSANLLNMGKQVFSARDAFSQRATEGLNQLQQALPFLAAAKAAALANSQDGALGTSYLAVAVLVPATAEEIIAPGNAGSDAIEQKVSDNEEDLRASSQLAEEYAQAAAEAKKRAFMADCGAAPERCMYERAAQLAGLASADNPKYESVDAWSFAVPLARAQAYYAARLANEAPLSQSLEEQARSALRKQLYRFALEELESAYVHDTEESFDAYFPTLPANAAELRASALYGKSTFPYTQGEDGPTLHAWHGCPAAAQASGTASLARMEAESWDVCTQCGFNVSTMASVAAASTSISNGFEYHYRLMAQAAADYEAARAKLDPALGEAKSLVGEIFEAVRDAADAAKSARIDAEPPGSKGCIAFVVGSSSEPVDAGFSSSFVRTGRTLGTRVALSAATMIEDPSGEGRSVLSSILDGFAPESSALGAAGLALDAWSALLEAYASGQNSLTNAVQSLLEGVPLNSASNLGTWAAKELSELIEGVGLEPADLDALKPVLVNSQAVAAAGQDGFSSRFLALKDGVLYASGPSSSAFSSALSSAETHLAQRIDDLEDGFEIARVELEFAGISISLELALPHAAGQGAQDFISRCLDAARNAYFDIAGGRVWQ